MAVQHDRRLAVVPNDAGWWVQAPQRNPLPIDWPQPIELSKPGLERQVVDQLLAQQGTIIVAVEKYEPSTLAEGLTLLDVSKYPIVQSVRSLFRKIGESDYFEIYE